MLDDRIIELSVQIGTQVKTYSGDFYITAKGSKFANANQNSCDVRIGNLTNDTRNLLLTETSPFNKNNVVKKLTVMAGRKSIGKFLVYTGDITHSVASQPPDIFVDLKSETANFKKSSVVSKSAGPLTSVEQIAKDIAKDLQMPLIFEAANKNIANYSFSGAQLKQVDSINDMGYNAYIDDDNLFVKDQLKPLSNSIVILDQGTGMIGVPELTEQGVKVKFMITANARLGGLIRVKSILAPQVNGDYMVYKLEFDIASRDTPFYWIAHGKKL